MREVFGMMEQLGVFIVVIVARVMRDKTVELDTHTQMCVNWHRIKSVNCTKVSFLVSKLS